MLPDLLDTRDGSVVLPDGQRLSASITQEAWRAAVDLGRVCEYDYGTRPWVYYRLDGGRVAEGQGGSGMREVGATLCFYGPALVSVSVYASLPGSAPWSEEGEVLAKRFYDRWLRETLGPPAREVRRPWYRPPPSADALLGLDLVWAFPWGQVGSFHDRRSYGTEITVGYKGRHPGPVVPGVPASTARRAPPA